MASIFLYRRSATRNFCCRVEINNLENLSIGMSQPVSAMPLPMEDADENILVKMEGNTETTNISWMIPDQGSSVLKSKAGGLTASEAEEDALYEWTGGSSGDPHDWDNTSPASGTTSNHTVHYLLNSFQGKDITDEYWLMIPDDLKAREGWIPSFTFSISGDSPVVWQGNLQFITGNVISAYDMDGASAPRNPAAHRVNSGGDADGEGGYSAPDTDIRIRWQAPSDSSSTITAYKLYRKDGSSKFSLHANIVPAASLGAVSGNNDYYEYKDQLNTIAGDTYWYFIKAFSTPAGSSGVEGMKSDEVTAVAPATH